MYFRKNDSPVSGGNFVENFSFDDVKSKKMWLYILLLIVLLVAVFMLMKSRKEKPRFGLQFY